MKDYRLHLSMLVGGTFNVKADESGVFVEMTDRHIGSPHTDLRFTSGELAPNDDTMAMVIGAAIDSLVKSWVEFHTEKMRENGLARELGGPILIRTEDDPSKRS